jgi:CRISPR-associated protein Cmr1
MLHITFHCRTISPMFIGGADSNQVELRPPSLKGALRFWWRAMNAHLVKNGSLDELKKRESEIFGNTQQRSSVLINFNLIKSITFNECLKDDLLYMAYGTNCRSAYGPATEFTVTFSSKSKEHLEEVQKAFSLLTHLGGLGAKSRNGFGAFTCDNVDSFKEICCYDCFKNNISSYAPYTAIGDKTQIYVSREAKNDWKQAIKELKKIYANAKKQVSPDKAKVYISAPYKDEKPPERHAKIHIMSMTMICGKIFYTITFLPYNYLAEYEKLEDPKIKQHFHA